MKIRLKLRKIVSFFSILPAMINQRVSRRAKTGTKLKATCSFGVLTGVIALLILLIGSIFYTGLSKHKEEASPVNIQLNILPSDDPETFLLNSARLAQLEINLQPIPGGQWEVSIAEAEQEALDHWLDYLTSRGVKVQSLHVLNLAAQGKVTVRLLRLITDAP